MPNVKKNLTEMEKLPLVEAPVTPEAQGAQEPIVSPEREAKPETAEATPPAASAITAPQAPTVSLKPQQLQKIESVLEEDLKDLYAQMSQDQRRLFREEGERTARAIDTLVSTAKAAAKRILFLIQRWLRIIPGINRWFLEQEAKIKTDKIMAIVEESSQQGKSS